MADREFADRLFVPWERLGWEYVEPRPPARSPEADREPTWVEPPQPLPRATPARRSTRLLGCLPLTTLLFLGAGLVYGQTVEVVAAIALAVLVLAVVVLRKAVPALRERAKLARFRQARDAAYDSYLRALDLWRKSIDAHDEAERLRYEAATRWYPLTSWSHADRIDVFGGTGDGWASLLVTLGCSRLATGANILVLDFTEQQVAGALAEFAARRGHEVRQWGLPADWPQWPPLAGLPPDELSELLADAVHTLRRSASTVDGRALSAELLGAVIGRLDGRPTCRRISAGLRVLRRVYDADGVLDDSEVARLTGAIDAFGHTERVQLELQFLTSVLDLLAAVEPEPGAPADEAGLWGPGVTVVTTAGGHRRRKDVLDRVVLHRVVRALRDHRGESRTLVVAGAEDFGRESLDELAHEAARAGVRLVLLVARLREELHDLLGGHDSATLLMRLGNAREAAAAAEFVGRGHRFVLNQLTEQVGETFTEGVGGSFSFSEGDSEAETQSASTSAASIPLGRVSITIPSLSGSRSSSITRSRTRTWQETVNRSVAGSSTRGRTMSRVYEFTVEPTTLQSLPATAFVLAEAGPSGRRVVLGDCNPGIVLLDKVAALPRRP
ncbi:hypothetical protein [Amycolatopsis sacchari]|uniref:hypothetical protein n=1 Tax=Amycolatopsis sacchari TaxID=115433 RepID=UPI003D71C016